ncbi:MAG: RidA family protein [Pseudomonadota bacterium]
MKRTSVNPTPWGTQYSMDQGEVVDGLRRILHVSGQASIGEDPDNPGTEMALHAGNHREQFRTSLANLDEVLAGAGMKRSNILLVRFYVADMEGFNANFDVYKDWIDEAGIRPPQTVIGVQCLALPEMLIEIEITAGD